MNVKEIKELIELLKDNEITELEIEREGVKIKLKKGSNNLVTHSIVSAPPLAPHAPVQISAPAASKKEEKPAEKKIEGITINSPMVGTFYKSPAPDAAAFVKEGDSIAEGKTVCIIEAMKLMNEIKSEVKGKIVKILVENGQPVEFGQPLFLVE
ncbi:MAG: acetyl-CoA carboxylase biotin carboxyl carrier protein [Candidatus Firestonebacteria bacterium]